ncbi:predicted protein [Chaetoceros tenuissimus]|uniref:Uncharacterized protein n=1 Tax=Chaetoceros tenuissimus TaxID=426638 RepID=A0AAD3CYT9_9STRA|nr:predicted protein [Chaetoceros tenuissimus]
MQDIVTLKKSLNAEKEIFHRMEDLRHQIATLNEELESLHLSYNRLRKMTAQIQSSVELLEKQRTEKTNTVSLPPPSLEQEENVDCQSILTGFTGISEFSLKPCANLLGASFKIQTPGPKKLVTDDFNYSDLYALENSSSRIRLESYDKFCSDRQTERLVEETLFKKPYSFKQKLAQTKRRIKKFLKRK